MSSFYLKLIALFFMIIDHIGVLLENIINIKYIQQNMEIPYYLQNVEYLRNLGRIAFPIYAFLISEGCYYTSNIKKYILRLLIFGFISQWPFYVITLSQSMFYDLNIFFTLSLACIVIYIYKAFPNRAIYSFLALIFLIFLYTIQILHTDYDYKGVSLIYFLYIIREKNKDIYITKIEQCTILLIFMCLLYPIYYNVAYLSLFLFSCISIPLIMYYNYERGPRLKYIFYFMYPFHLIILALIQIYILA